MTTTAPRPDPGAPAAPEDFLIRRTFAAPREMVYRAWVDVRHMQRWWGPKTFTCPVCELDLRPGGRYRMDMLSPTGVVYPFNGEFVEIVPNERLVMKMDALDPPEEWEEEVRASLHAAAESDVRSIQQVDFEDEDGGTRVTVRIRFASEEVRNAMVGLGMDHGWDGILEKLGEELQRMHAERATA